MGVFTARYDLDLSDYVSSLKDWLLLGLLRLNENNVLVVSCTLSPFVETPPVPIQWETGWTGPWQVVNSGRREMSYASRDSNYDFSVA
jgi:hypothetical protein